MDTFLSTAANVAQLLTLRHARDACMVLAAVALWQLGHALWTWMDWKSVHFRPASQILLWSIVLAVAAIGLYYFAEGAENLVRNPRFKEGTKYWGTGYIESRITNGNWPFLSDQIRLPLVLSGGAIATARRDASTSHDGGWASFLIEHQSPVGDHVWSSVSQLVAGLDRDTDYVASYWIRAEHLGERTFFLTLDHQWLKPNRYYADPGTYEWRQVISSPFNTGNQDFVDFRFVMQGPGKVWIDDVALYKRRKP